VICLSLLVLTSCLNAANSKARQGWDMVHITGSCVGTAYLNHLGLEWYESAIVMLSLGIIWELCDQVAYDVQWKQSYFDYHRGGEWKDITRNVVGISLSFPIRRK